MGQLALAGRVRHAQRHRGRHLPTALRAFLLTLAVVDDFLGIVVAVAAWGFMHASGVHATTAGVILGFTVPALTRRGERTSLDEHFEHLWRPVSAGLAVPVFALFAARVAMSPADLASAAGDPAARGVALGLVLGKPIGIMAATFLPVKVTRATLDPTVTWTDLFAVSVVAGVGFTVSLLIGELSFESGSPHSAHVKAAVLIGSVTAAAMGGILLTWRSRVHLHSQGANRESILVV